MFGTMTNATSPTAHLGQRRGVISAGSMVSRNRVMSANMVSFVPPSFSAGCGGIDLFGGSFSFINMNQFVDLMRAVASNAAGYAFQLAINAMCPDCGRRSAFTTHCNNGSYVKFYITAKSRPPPDCSG